MTAAKRGKEQRIAPGSLRGEDRARWGPPLYGPAAEHRLHKPAIASRPGHVRPPVVLAGLDQIHLVAAAQTALPCRTVFSCVELPCDRVPGQALHVPVAVRVDRRP